MEERRQRDSASGTPASIRSALKKATAEMLVLSALQKKPMYVYEIKREIERASEGQIVFHTLYPTINHLQKFKYVTQGEKVLSEENRMRIYISLTESGREYLMRLTEEYNSFVHATNNAMDTLAGT